jgi:hypothetical protein
MTSGSGSALVQCATTGIVLLPANTTPSAVLTNRRNHFKLSNLSTLPIAVP